MNSVATETAVNLSIPDDMATRNLRPACITRTFVIFIFIFSASSLLYTTTQLHFQKGTRTKTVRRDTREGSLQHDSVKVNNFSLLLDNSAKRQLQKTSNLTLSRKLLPISHINDSKADGVGEAKRQMILRGNVTLNERARGQTVAEKVQLLEKEHLILVESHKMKMLREKASRRKEMKEKKTRTWEEIQAVRRHLVTDMCEQRPEHRNGSLERIIVANRTKLSQFLVSDRFRIILMAVPTAASGFWKEAFKQLPFPGSRSGRSAEDDGLKVLSSYDKKGIRYRLQAYQKLLFVRDPFARLVSAYRRKFLTSTAYSKQYTSLIADTYRQWNTGTNASQPANITFQEFAYFVEDSLDDIFDSLWQPISKMALPCEIKYDFIGKLEGGISEFNNMLKSAKIHSLVKYKPSDKTPSHEGSIYDYYFLQLWTNQIKRLYTKYEDDFLMFGYSIPNYMHPWVFGGFR